jgi:hypothetical protein
MIRKILPIKQAITAFPIKKIIMIFNKKRKRLIKLINGSKFLGLPEKDIIVCKEFVKNREYGLAFDHLVTQLYEFDIEINKVYYKEIKAYAELINLNENDYNFVQELLRSEENIPKSVKDGISVVVKNLKDSTK